MMNVRKWTQMGMLLVLLLLTLLLFGGCTKKEEKAAYSPKNPITITVWSYYNGAQLASFNSAVEQFNATEGAERGIVVTSSSLGNVTDMENSVMDSAQGRVGAQEMPNIFAAYSDTAYALDQMELVADLSDYFTNEERKTYVDSYLSEGDFKNNGSIKIVPVAKATEILALNKTDWDRFAEATGAQVQDFATMEGLLKTAQQYYEWTDSLTDEPNDGRAFFGRDAMANYMLIGAMQLGTEIFSVEDGKATIHFDHDTIRTLWDHYYVPYVKGYFAASGRFRSDDVKTGNVIAYVGSSSSATYFPDQVILSDAQSYEIVMEAYPVPQFEGGQAYAVQQGAGMVVTKQSEAEVEASVCFLKWFTQDAQSIDFSIASGYLPVKKTANDMQAITERAGQISDKVEKILQVSVDTVNTNKLYTNKAFAGGTDARAILENAMSAAAVTDRETVVQRLAQGMTMEEACEPFLQDDCFETWYRETLDSLNSVIL